MPANNQPKATTPSPSRRDSSSLFCVRSHSTTATASVPADECQSAAHATGSPCRYDTRPQNPINSPTTPSNQAITWNTVLKFIGRLYAAKNESILDTAAGRQ